MPSVLISTFRKKITRHSTLIIILLTVLILGLFVMRIAFREINPFFKEGFALMVTALLVTALFIHNRRSSRLKALKSSDPSSTVNELESLIQKDRDFFQKTQMFRIIVGTVLLSGFIFLLFFFPDSWLTIHAFVVFIAIILITILQGWMLMKDGIMLQDIKHAMRDHPSDIS